MASRSRPRAAKRRRRMLTQNDKAHNHQDISESPLRRSLRIAEIATVEKGSRFQADTEEQARDFTGQKNLCNPQHIQKPAVETSKRARDPENHISTEQPRKRLQTRTRSRTRSDSVRQAEKQRSSREDQIPPFHASPEIFSKRERKSAASVSKPAGRKTISEARIDYWRDNGTWPTEEHEKTMDRFRDTALPALARKRSSPSLRRKRSEASINTETVPTRTPSDQQSRELKSTPYRHPRYEGQLKERGSYMVSDGEGVTAESSELCEKLLKAPQSPLDHTLFSDDDIFRKTCNRIRGENETKVIRDIAQLIVPSAEILADYGAKHLEILRETTNAGWNNAIPFYGPRPQPDFSLGFSRYAFTREQLEKLQPFIGNELEDCSYIAATYDMYLPFLTSEVKCGASALDVADRQNAHSQTVALRGLIELFRLVGRETELHREINGFSISHSDENVRIFGHYAVINGRDFTFYRHSIAKFDISKTVQGDHRWLAYTFVRNVYDLWIPEHFKRICSAIDMLPADLNFEVSEQSEPNFADEELASSRSGLSQRLEDYGFADEQAIVDNEPSVQQITPDATVQTESSKSKKKKKK